MESLQDILVSVIEMSEKQCFRRYGGKPKLI